jgi:hypothetical protein
MNINFIKVFLLSSLLLSLAIGCKKSVETTKPIKGDLKVVLLGELIPRFVEIDESSIATVKFVGLDQTYRYDLNTIHANTYWGKLKQAQNNSTTLKVYVTKQTEIVRVE